MIGHATVSQRTAIIHTTSGYELVDLRAGKTLLDRQCCAIEFKFEESLPRSMKIKYGDQIFNCMSCWRKYHAICGRKLYLFQQRRAIFSCELPSEALCCCFLKDSLIVSLADRQLFELLLSTCQSNVFELEHLVTEILGFQNTLICLLEGKNVVLLEEFVEIAELETESVRQICLVPYLENYYLRLLILEHNGAVLLYENGTLKEILFSKTIRSIDAFAVGIFTVLDQDKVYLVEYK